MARKRKDDLERSEEDFEDFVPAVFARSAEEAEEYREILNDHDIPAIVGDDGLIGDKPGGRQKPPAPKGMTRGVPVLVPEVLLDEASEVIADRDYDELQEEETDEDEDEEVGLAGGTGEDADLAAEDVAARAAIYGDDEEEEEEEEEDDLAGEEDEFLDDDDELEDEEEDD